MKKVLFALIATLTLSVTAHANSVDEFTGTWVEITNKNNPHTLVITAVSDNKVRISQQSMYGKKSFQHKIEGAELKETNDFKRTTYRLKGDTLEGSGLIDMRSYTRK